MAKISKAGAVAAGLLAGLFTIDSANAAENVSGDVGITYNSHFVSFGADVWGGGGSFYGKRATTSIYGDLGVKVTDSLTLTLNGWSDINDNVPSGIGGNLQEIDINAGGAYTFDKFTVAVTYGAWSYAGDVEEVIDTSVAFNDMGMLAPDFALNPKVTWHYRGGPNGGQQVGSAIVISVGPTFPLMENLSLTIPAGVAFFTTKDFQGGNESGYGFSYVGGSLGYALGLPAAYGAWSVNFDVIAYFTDDKAIPGNPAASFVTGSMGLKIAY